MDQDEPSDGQEHPARRFLNYSLRGLPIVLQHLEAYNVVSWDHYSSNVPRLLDRFRLCNEYNKSQPIVNELGIDSKLYLVLVVDEGRYNTSFHVAEGSMR